MEFFTPKYRRDPNAPVHSAYIGLTQGRKVVTRIVKRNPDGKMETTIIEEPHLQPGEGGFVAHIILGGMETSLAEIEYLIEANREKKFVPRKSNKQVADMCRLLLEKRNEQIKYLRKNPSELSNLPKRKPILHLPVGFHYKDTPEPGLKILARV